MIYSCWDIEQNRLKLVTLGHFLPFYPPHPPLKLKEIKTKKKKKKLLEISSFYTCVPKIKIIWCPVPEIWSEIDRIFCRFGPFLPFCYPWQPAKSKLWKSEKKPHGDIILQMRTINENHMMYGSWDMEHDWQNFLSLWTIFCPFTTQKIKIFKK